jgi:hypothetical protein
MMHACMLQWSTATADLRVVLLPVAERILLRPGIDMRHIIILSRRCVMAMIHALHGCIALHVLQLADGVL